TCEWQSTKPGLIRPRLPRERGSALEVELELGRHHSKLAERSGLELTHPLTRDAEAGADLFERLRRLAVEPEPACEDEPHAGVEVVERLCQLGLPQPCCRLGVRLVGLRVLDQVAVEALAVADRGLEADGILNEIEEF